jgi:hypothetical protein
MRPLRSMRALAFAALGLFGCTGAIGGGANGGNTTGPGGTVTPPGGTAPGQTPTPTPTATNPAAEIAGRTPMRRLTHDEYNNTVRDLLGVNGDFASAFAGDEDANGFAANTVSPVSEDQADNYHSAADAIAAKAMAAGIGKLASCTPGDACADQFVRTFGRRAFRRPLTAEETARYKQVYTVGSTGADFASGLQLVITAMLESPNFLYLPEHGDRARAEKDAVPLDPYETAARLSYFIIGSMPDDELSAAADAGNLKTPDQVAAQAKRLLATPKARTSMASFYLQWLELTDVAGLDKDPKLFPQFTPAVKAAMGAEVTTFGSRTTLEGDGKLASIFTSTTSYPNADLAPIYGLPSAGDGNTPVALPKGQRGGILTLPGVMAVYAGPDQTKPVGRGFLIADKLLCSTPPAPPANVPLLPPPDPNVTTRQRLERHRSDPSCSACHALFDPLGLTFEIYDPIGRYSTTDGKNAIDATGKALPSGFGDVKDATELLPKLAASDAVRSCMVKQWFRYGMGRVETADDNATLAAAQAAFAKSDYVVRDLLVGLTSTRGFRYRALLQQ